MIKIIVDKPYEGSMNMALDISIAKLSAIRKISTLRIYQWKYPTLSLGKHQKTDNLNWEFIKSKNISVVRRPSGGRAVLHKDEITYSFSTFVKNENLPNNLLASYMKISQALIRSLNELGIEADLESSKKEGVTKDLCYDAPSFYEVKVNGKKLIGSAQYRTANFILQHGSIPIKHDYETYINSFKYSHTDWIKHHLTSSTIDLETILKKPISKMDIVKAFEIGFKSVFKEEISEGFLEHDEIILAQEIKNNFTVLEEKI
ncbi:lipoate--protein ligase family protein [Petrotoga sp. 8T1HF07.NaAc.6.1]|uniref:lipoate--protein ligase family protein n=1 Tax=Petrotoga sp. 8T1HF07.NaAc.6.1 TaxID=1351838 RepID=UPI00192B3CEA|nr:lipoate--protein ligase family protein [Petrotoga sp. 8T1HF07.NaAc.6.1]